MLVANLTHAMLQEPLASFEERGWVAVEQDGGERSHWSLTARASGCCRTCAAWARSCRTTDSGCEGGLIDKAEFDRVRELTRLEVTTETMPRGNRVRLSE